MDNMHRREPAMDKNQSSQVRRSVTRDLGAALAKIFLAYVEAVVAGDERAIAHNGALLAAASSVVASVDECARSANAFVYRANGEMRKVWREFRAAKAELEANRHISTEVQ